MGGRVKGTEQTSDTMLLGGQVITESFDGFANV